MKFCKVCGTQLPDEAAFCTNCGNTIEQTTVVNADNTIDDDGTTVLVQDDFDEGTTVLDESEGTTILEEYPIDGAVFTPHQPPIYEPPIGTTPVNPVQNQQFTFEQFFDAFASKKTKSNAKWLGIITIITAVLSLILVVSGSLFNIIDLIFYGVFVVLLNKKKNWLFPLIVTCYSGAFTVINLAMGGAPGGIVALILGIMTTISFKKLNDAYKAYQTSGQVPSGQI